MLATTSEWAHAERGEGLHWPLTSTFQHFSGISPRTERAMWRDGIRQWQDYGTLGQLALFPDERFAAEVQRSEQALLSGDAMYFANRLARRDHWRIAAAFPPHTLYLDIESTGLSLYYDRLTMVGWTMGDRYQALLTDEGFEELSSVLSGATSIVTFNGTLFDLPFLRLHDPSLVLPPVHVDLRYLARRVGLVGGQKSVEAEVGFHRPPGLLEVDGREAAQLWHRYERGDLQALRLLLEYNHHDVEGMRHLFRTVITRVADQEGMPLPQDTYWGSWQRSVLQTSTNPSADAIHIRPYTGPTGPKVRMGDIPQVSVSGLSRVVGIDLTGSSRRKSGWCLLVGETVETRLLATDDELLNATRAVAPTVVSIDAPLSMPRGRTAVTDDDPGRQQFGIVRECERVLRRRGINVYPALLPSMQKLTARGMHLAAVLRRDGIPVIESYPGGVQDILGIPRKGASVEGLKQGLIEYGLGGAFVERPVNHDELDAISSALVGSMFLAGWYEPVGNEDEEFLILPTLEPPGRARTAIGFSGRTAAGKTTAARMLEENGYRYVRFSEVLAEHEGVKRNDRWALRAAGGAVQARNRQRHLAKLVASRLADVQHAVVDGLRFPDDHAILYERFASGFIHVHLTAVAEEREARFAQSKGPIEEFKAANNHVVESGADKMRDLAHAVIDTSGGHADWNPKLMKLVRAMAPAVPDDL